MKIQKVIKNLMKKNGFSIIRNKKHIVWLHENGKWKITTSASPSSQNVIRCIMKDIKAVTGVCYA